MRKAIFLIMLLLIVACKPQDTSTKVGVMLPLSGDAASYGESIKRGIELAKSNMQADIELVYVDSKCEGKEAVSSLTKLLTVDNVVAVIGEVCSGATLAAAPVAESNGVVMVSPSSTSPDITDNGFVYRTVPSDALQGSFGAGLVKEHGHDKLAILYSNEEYGVGFSKVLEESFEGEVVASEAFDRGSVDLRTQITKIKSAKPDAVYVISNSPDSAAAALKQLKELKVGAAVYGSEGLKSDAILESAAEAAEGLIVTSVSSGSSEFIAKHEEAHEEGPGPFAAQGYDAYQALALVVHEGATTAEEIKSGLGAVSFTGASGKIVFDENGDIEGNYDVFVVEEGAFVAQNEIELEMSYTP